MEYGTTAVGPKMSDERARPPIVETVERTNREPAHEFQRYRNYSNGKRTQYRSKTRGKQKKHTSTSERATEYTDVNVLAGRLRKEVKNKTCFHQDIQTLRLRVRDGYVALLFQNYEENAARNVEQTLWKLCFYNNIEEYRKLLRKAIQQKDQVTIPQICQQFRGFLSSSTRFYLELLRRLADHYHLPLRGLDRDLLGLDPVPSAGSEHGRTTDDSNSMGSLSSEDDDRDDDSEEESYDNQEIMISKRDQGDVTDEEEDDASEEDAEEIPDAVAYSDEHPAVNSIHRCLIFLGDLARYHRDLVGDPNQKTWHQAQKYYRQALRLLPHNGNPHNQLAVIASYNENDLAAIYHYYRSLSTAIPFVAANENLRTAFERNKKQIEHELATREKEEYQGGAITGINDNRNKRKTIRTKSIESSKKFLSAAFVRLHGILYTASGSTSWEEFNMLKEICLKEYAMLLKPKGNSIPLDSETILRITSCNIYLLSSLLNHQNSENACQGFENPKVGSHDSHKSVSSNSNTSREAIQIAALKMCFEFAARIASRAASGLVHEEKNCNAENRKAKSEKINAINASLFPSISVFVQWLRWMILNHPDLIWKFRDVERGSFFLFFKSFVALLNNLIKQIGNSESGRQILDDSFEPTTTHAERGIFSVEEVELRGFNSLPFSPYDASVLLPLWPWKPLSDKYLMERKLKVLEIGKKISLITKVGRVKYVNINAEQEEFSDFQLLYFTKPNSRFGVRPFYDVNSQQTSTVLPSRPYSPLIDPFVKDQNEAHGSDLLLMTHAADDEVMEDSDMEYGSSDVEGEEQIVFKPGDGAKFDGTAVPVAKNASVLPVIGSGANIYNIVQGMDQLDKHSTATSVALRAITDDETFVDCNKAVASVSSTEEDPDDVGEEDLEMSKTIADSVLHLMDMEDKSFKSQLLTAAPRTSSNSPPISKRAPTSTSNSPPLSKYISASNGMEKSGASASSQISALFGSFPATEEAKESAAKKSFLMAGYSGPVGKSVPTIYKNNPYCSPLPSSRKDSPPPGLPSFWSPFLPSTVSSIHSLLGVPEVSSSGTKSPQELQNNPWSLLNSCNGHTSFAQRNYAQYNAE